MEMTSKDIDTTVNDVEQGTSFIEAANRADKLLPLRELEGLDKQLRTIRGSLKVAIAKCIDLEGRTEREDRKLNELCAKNSGTKLNTDQTMETVNQQQETVTKQKNSLRTEQGKRLVEYNYRKKEKLKRLNEKITKQDDMMECKPIELSNNYLYISGVSVVGLAIVGYILYNIYKKPEQNLIDIPPPSNVSLHFASF